MLNDTKARTVSSAENVIIVRWSMLRKGGTDFHHHLHFNATKAVDDAEYVDSFIERFEWLVEDAARHQKQAVYFHGQLGSIAEDRLVETLNTKYPEFSFHTDDCSIRW